MVYLVYSQEGKGVFALKTFRDEYLLDAEIRERFRREASIWVDLEHYAYVVRAHFVDEMEGRFYIAMEYIAPDEEGLNSLQGYLTRRPPDLARSLRWAIHVCHGMEYAYSKGVRCHRDLNPRNIMITYDGTAKIADFGLAGVLGASRASSGAKVVACQGPVGLSTMGGGSFGTPTHMPPEQFTDAKDCDERSDIYAFGIVLYQMATGGRLPFLAPLPRDDSQEEQKRFFSAMYRLHNESPAPKLNSPLSIAIQRCLEKEPAKRYQTFKELREELEPLLKRQTGKVIKPPELEELETWEWVNKGFSLDSLGRSDEAIRCYDRALEIDPWLDRAWGNKGVVPLESGSARERADYVGIDIPLVKPDISFEGIEGHEEVKLVLRDLAFMMRMARERPELTITPRARHTSILLYGPPGPDKLRLAMAMANECGGHLILVDCKDTQNELTTYIPIGGVKRIKAIFSKAADNIPCTIFPSGIDAVARPRGGVDFRSFSTFYARRETLLNELDRPRDGVIVMAETNRMDLLDVYIWGKFLKRLEAR